MRVRSLMLFVIVLIAAGSLAAQEPLPSWNDGAAKASILAFVEKVTDKSSPHYVLPAERIAVFDNDGTLWPENPLPFQLLFALDELKRLAPEHPEWRDNPALQAALNGDVAELKEGGTKALLEVIAASHSGMTTDEFDDRVRNWLQTARHPRFDRPYNELGYQPMIELLAYLRANGFKTFIVSGGGADFMRVWAEEAYGIPPEQVVGSVGGVHYQMTDRGPVLIKDAGVAFIDDKAGKPVGIHRQIGRRPIAAFGNSDGDKEMLEWTTIGRNPSFGLIVRHTDNVREYAYDANPTSSGKLVEALAEAPGRGWVVVDMERDWKQVFAD